VKPSKMFFPGSSQILRACGLNDISVSLQGCVQDEFHNSLRSELRTQ
jgi:hypothetical protein